MAATRARKQQKIPKAKVLKTKDDIVIEEKDDLDKAKAVEETKEGPAEAAKEGTHYKYYTCYRL